jgi:hypothetical protein
VLPLADLKTMDDVARYPWPSADDYDYSVIPEQCESVKDYAVCLGDAGSPDIVNGVSRGRGMQQVLMDIGLRDEVGLAIIDRRVEFTYQVLRRGLEAARGKVDILCLGEDCGNQKGRMVSPRDFDEVFRPRLQRFYDLAHPVADPAKPVRDYQVRVAKDLLEKIDQVQLGYERLRSLVHRRIQL